MFGTAAKRRIKRSDMNSIATQYLGLELSGPVIMGSSGLTSTLRHIVEAEEAGAGAVVLKSVFEEQILHEASRLDRYSDYPEAGDYVRRYVSEHALAQCLDLIREARDRCAIPVIASIHCVHPGEWVSFARSIEQAGASAIELNIFVLPTDAGLPSEQIERAYFDIAAQVREVVSVPLAVKLGAGFTNPLRIVRGLYARGIQGVVLFNRFYPADIDIDRLTVRAGNLYSHRSELSGALRWAALVSGSEPGIDVAVSTGVHQGEDVVKAMLAGASAVEIASAVYERGLGVIAEMNRFVGSWMERRAFLAARDFVGRMNARNIPDPELYERTQFMKYYSCHE